MLALPFDLRSLVDKALRERGEAVAVIANPVAGEEATIQSASESFAHLMGLSGNLEGMRLSSLRSRAEFPREWSIFMTALRRQAPLQLVMQLEVGGRKRCFQFRITFDQDDGEAQYAILVGRDVSRARRLQSQADEPQRLLASVFLHVGAAVLIVRATGEILMSNPACQQLLGYDAEGLAAVTVGVLPAPEYRVAAAAARAKQLQDGGRYELRLVLLTRTGSRVPVRLSSSLLEDVHEQKLRVVTLIPEWGGAGRAGPLDGYGTPGEAVGQLVAVSLEALREGCGEAWPRLQPRAMMLAEGVLKRRLAGSDVFSRSDDDGFIVWFDSREAGRNEATLTAIVREIRLRALVELGEEIAGQAELPGAERPLDEAARLLHELRTATPDCWAVSDREGRAKSWWLVEFPASLRARLAATASLRPRGDEGAAEIDLLRYGLALDQLAARPASDTILVRVAWPVLTGVEARRRLDEGLARMEAACRTRLVLIVSGLPALLTAKRWSEVVTPLRRQVQDVAPALTVSLAETPLAREGAAAEWPLSLLMIDGTETASQRPDTYFKLLETARRRDIAVLVRSSRADLLDWRELGATMFVTVE